MGGSGSLMCFCGAAFLVFAFGTCIDRSAPLLLAAAPADYWDVPESLAANADGAIYVSFRTDTMESVVRIFSADGAVLSHWQVGDYETGSYVAESGDGGVYVARPGIDVVRHYTEDGQQTAEWPSDGLQGAIATAPQSGATDTEVHVIAATAQGDREVRRHSPVGVLRASFAVAGLAHDLTISPAGQADGPYVFVAEGMSARGGDPIYRYHVDGTWVDGVETSGGIAGMDVNGASGRLWVGYSQVSPAIRYLQEWTYDWQLGTRCELPGFPVDLTIGKGGDIYVLLYGDPEHDLFREIRRYREDCTPVDTWDLVHLNRFPPATPTGPASTTATPVSSETPTSTPGGSDTPIVSTPTTQVPSATPLPPLPTATHTVTATAYHAWLCFPAAWREYRLGQ